MTEIIIYCIIINWYNDKLRVKGTVYVHFSFKGTNFYNQLEGGYMSYTIDEIETLNKKSNNKNEGVAILHNPAYREKWFEFFNEAQRKVMDMVQFYDGTIVLIENRIAMYYYTWDSKRRELQRKKQQTVTKNNNS